MAKYSTLLLPALFLVSLLAKENSFAESRPYCSSVFESVTKNEIVLNAKTAAVRQQLLNGSFADWENGILNTSKLLHEKKQAIEKLNSLEKSQLLESLNINPEWNKAPAGHRQFISMLLNDSRSWGLWIEFIHQHGMNFETVIPTFQTTIEQMPENLRLQIASKIAKVYRSKSNVNYPSIMAAYEFNNSETMRLSNAEKERLRNQWQMPKRVFDLMIQMLTQSTHQLYLDLRNEKPALNAYEEYLARLRLLHENKEHTYTAEDVYSASLAMQQKLRELIQDPGFQKQGLFKNYKPYIIIYGSYPNGMANFHKGSDIDLAVSYSELATGDMSVQSHLTAWERMNPGTVALEGAAIEVLKRNLNLAEIYDPKSHGAITEERLYDQRLDFLSPVMIKISVDSIELIVRKAQYKKAFLSDRLYNFSDSKITRELK